MEVRVDDLGRGRFKIFCDDQEMEDAELAREEDWVSKRQESRERRTHATTKPGSRPGSQ